MNWREGRLKHLSSVPITNGLGEAGAEGEPHWPRYIRTTDIAGPRTLRTDIHASLPPSTAGRALLRRGDIVFTAAGATIGKSLLYDEPGEACYAGYLVRFRPTPATDGRFISYWAQSEPYWGQLETGKVVSTIENFSASKYKNLELMVPPRHEQRAIADFLDGETARIDALIAKKRRMILSVGERRAAHIDELFSRSDWTETRLKRLLIRPPVYGVLVPTFVDEGVPFARVNDLAAIDRGIAPAREISVAQSQEYSRTILNPGDVLVSVVGSIDKSAIVPDQTLILQRDELPRRRG